MKMLNVGTIGCSRITVSLGKTTEHIIYMCLSKFVSNSSAGYQSMRAIVYCVWKENDV